MYKILSPYFTIQNRVVLVKGMMRSLLGLFSINMAMDLGTANTLVYTERKGIVVNEPSVVALTRYGNLFLPYAFGYDAKMMLGRSPIDIKTVRPLRGGIITDFKTTEEMVKYFIQTASKKRKIVFIKPKVIVCVPYGSTPVERRAIQESVITAGARDVFLTYEPMAAAVGAGLPVTEPIGSMIVDIGGGTTEIGILSLGGMVYACSIRIGGDTIDDSIIEHVRKDNSLYIGECTAERVKKRIGYVRIGSKGVNDNVKNIFIKGRDVETGIPKKAQLFGTGIEHCILSPSTQISRIVRSVLEKAPPEIASDIGESGITITGGGALLENLDILISKNTTLNVQIAPSPLHCVVLGIGKILENFQFFRHLVFKQD